ncbi:GNAT family N-acetyltransferase [aff. Roholtiella sp. LEGE 12411]|uniref:GNAT family N-acetyltransferase n=1 Tax=aff. Roholtiella sp. LEGE 12411 TaxID=1828822 RepID=UPI001880BE57|nr:GNAT family N-acetyltransferase [aff. Roholtiella sp. LEGE 12411]MBE9035704.1 GNAT family N-acetyltransferase [aff. Roholtiella sp. LEGE 12411]
MYTVDILNDSNALTYEQFTFPKLRPNLHNLNSNNSLVAIGACEEEKPIGLALGKVFPGGEFVEVLSIFVAPPHRGAGIGTTLLTRLEQELQVRGCKQAELVYMSGKTTTPALEHMLQKRHWTTPETRMLVCKGKAETIIQAPWMKKYSRLPSEYSIFPWIEITPQERQAIQEQQKIEPWIPKDLIPFLHEENLEPINSLGLRYQAHVVGWVINHRISPDTILYTCSFVRKDLQKMGRIISLYAEASKRQFQANIPNGIWTVPLEHESMVKFVKHRLAPYLISVTETRGTFKLLQ